jgi:redox-sensitive bicupin YhaK (pirin superfamily)
MNPSSRQPLVGGPAFAGRTAAQLAVRRAVPNLLRSGHQLIRVGPFALLDHWGPEPLAAGAPHGREPYPQLGLDHLTWVVQGATAVRSSLGDVVLHAGDLQWMSTGSGLTRAEQPAAGLAADGGITEGLSLWLAPARAHRQDPPRRQEVRAADIPTAQEPGACVRVLLGEHAGLKSAIQPPTPALWLDVSLEADATVVLPLPPEDEVACYTLSGMAIVGSRGMVFPAGELAVLDRGDQLHLQALGGPARVLVLGGPALADPYLLQATFLADDEQALALAWARWRGGELPGIG